MAFGAIALAAMLAACTGDNSFQKQAYALGKSYEGAQRGAITYIEVASPSSEVTAKIVNADKKAAPLVKDVLECAKSMLVAPPAPDDQAVALGLDATEALEAACQGKLSEALLAIDTLRNVIQEK